MGIFTLCDILPAMTVPRSRRRMHKIAPHSYMRPAVDFLSLSVVLPAFSVPSSIQRLRRLHRAYGAAGNGHLDVVRCLTCDFGAKIEATDAESSTALMLAAPLGILALCDVLPATVVPRSGQRVHKVAREVALTLSRACVWPRVIAHTPGPPTSWLMRSAVAFSQALLGSAQRPWRTCQNAVWHHAAPATTARCAGSSKNPALQMGVVGIQRPFEARTDQNRLPSGDL